MRSRFEEPVSDLELPDVVNVYFLPEHILPLLSFIGFHSHYQLFPLHLAELEEQEVLREHFLYELDVLVALSYADSLDVFLNLCIFQDRLF